ncbi:hypothetical protein [Pelagicoccus sp. SDUM812003]|uniref:hypothetical protein n=1 Tax=Pelagicoccus sp. SDUM812003 TaxID=3041267 RepID=UPI00280EA54A|nr:hypothetical protein [Pelagicoccus sp. SDUM812003]MDQ8205826.1 hypothetical protein [Pelagicoccus sp. SDUM812003]
MKLAFAIAVFCAFHSGYAKDIEVFLAPNAFRVIQLGCPSVPFHVVLMNTSNEDIKVWDDMYFWGYYNLSFEMRSSSGNEIIEIKKKERGWDKNLPLCDTVPPKEVKVFAVFLCEETWEGIPSHEWFTANDKNPFEIRAIYKSQSDTLPMNSDSGRVWKGTIESNWTKTYVKKTGVNQSAHTTPAIAPR